MAKHLFSTNCFSYIYNI